MTEFNGRPSSFTDEDWRKIHEHVESGLTLEQIAEKIGRPTTTLASALQKRGIATRHEKAVTHPVEVYDRAVAMLAKDANLSIKHAARRVGVSATALTNFLKSTNLHEKFADRCKLEVTGLSRGEVKKKSAAERRKIRLLVGNIYRDVRNDRLFLAVTERLLVGGENGRIFERGPSTKHHYEHSDELSVDDLATSWGVSTAEIDRAAKSYMRVALSAAQRAAKMAVKMPRKARSYEPRVYEVARRRNSDTRVRALERTARASGTPSDYTAWWRELVRTGTNSGDATLAVLAASRMTDGVMRLSVLVPVLENLFRSGSIRFEQIDDESVAEAFRRVSRAADDDGDTTWCDSNDCEQPGCHRCWPREGCDLHEKCSDFASRGEAPVVETDVAETAMRWMILQRSINDGSSVEWGAPGLPDMTQVGSAHADWVLWAQESMQQSPADMSLDRARQIRARLRAAVDAAWDLVYPVALSAIREAVALLEDAEDDEFVCSRCERVSFDVGMTSCGECGERFCLRCDSEGGAHGGYHSCHGRCECGEELKVGSDSDYCERCRAERGEEPEAVENPRRNTDKALRDLERAAVASGSLDDAVVLYRAETRAGVEDETAWNIALSHVRGVADAVAARMRELRLLNAISAHPAFEHHRVSMTSECRDARGGALDVEIILDLRDGQWAVKWSSWTTTPEWRYTGGDYVSGDHDTILATALSRVLVWARRRRRRNPYWGRAGSGLMLFSPDRRRVLLTLRSGEVEEPGTWGVPGGRAEDSDLYRSALRETREELGSVPDHEVFGQVVFEDGGFRFTTFLAMVGAAALEWEPRLNWESDDAAWFDVGDLPDDLHFGVEHIVAERPGLFAMVERQED